MRHNSGSSFALLAGFILLASLGCASDSAEESLAWSVDSPHWGARALLTDTRITECSGLMPSRRHRGIYWIHNDSGDTARLFAMDVKGNVIAEIEVPAASHIDWEDLAMDDDGHLYLCDVGNNDSVRRDLTVYVIDEPDPYDPEETAEVLRTLRFRYPDQTGFPDPTMNFDCEAVFWRDDHLYFLTKHRGDTDTCLYRMDDLQTPREQDLVFLDRFPAESQVTGADLSPDGRELAMLSYEYLYLFQIPDGEEKLLTGSPAGRILLEARQCECISHEGDVLRIVNEQREMHVISRRAVLDAGAWSQPETPRRYIAPADLPAVLAKGYRPTRPRAVLESNRFTRLPLAKGFGEKINPLPAAPDTATVVVSRVEVGLRVGLMWTPPAAGELRVIVGWISWSTAASDRSWAGADDNACRIVFEDGRIRLEAESTAPATILPDHRLRWRGDRIEGWVALPVGSAEAPSLSVVLLAPEGGDWSWGGDSSMFAWLNPFLWGEIAFSE